LLPHFTHQKPLFEAGSKEALSPVLMKPMVEEICQFDVNAIGYRNKNKRLHARKLYFFSTLALAGFCRDRKEFATNMNKCPNPFVTMELFFNMPLIRISPFSPPV
jgi:hypothetical protein